MDFFKKLSISTMKFLLSFLTLVIKISFVIIGTAIKLLLMIFTIGMVSSRTAKY